MILVFYAQEGQSILDVVLNTYGTPNMMGKFITDNGITNLNAVTKTGSVFIYDTDFIEDQSLFNYMTDKKLIFRTGINDTPNYILYEDENIMTAEDLKLFTR